MNWDVHELFGRGVESEVEATAEQPGIAAFSLRQRRSMKVSAPRLSNCSRIKAMRRS